MTSEANDGARKLLAEIVRCNDEAPEFGMCDQRDNDGEWYQSADLACILIAARRVLNPQAPTPLSNAREGNGR